MEPIIIDSSNKITNQAITRYIKYVLKIDRSTTSVSKNIREIIVKYYDSVLKALVFISKEKKIETKNILNFYNMSNYVVSKPYFPFLSNYYIIQEILYIKYKDYNINKNDCNILINKMENYIKNIIIDGYKITLKDFKKKIRNKDINIIKDYLYNSNEKTYYTRLLDFSNKAY